MKTKLFPFLIAQAIAVCSQAQQQLPGSPVLFPVSVPRATAGGYGTIWQSEVWVHNGSNVPLVTQRGFCIDAPGVPPCQLPSHPPGTTEQEFAGDLSSDNNAVVLFYAPSVAASISFSNRLFELSRHTQPVGVDIPVIREQDLFTAPVQFIGVSGSGANRVALRVYDPMHRAPSSVRIELLTTTGAAVATGTFSLQYLTDIHYPGYAANYDLAAAFPLIRGMERFDIRVTPLSEGLQFYALVSVTDIDTQQVVLITTKQ